MLDWYKLMNLINNDDQDSINEIAYEFPRQKKRSQPAQLIIRSKYGGGGTAGSPSVHSCSIKVKLDTNRIYPIMVPKLGEQIDESNKNKVSTGAYIREVLDDDKLYKAVVGFIYVNQVAILAYWNSPDEERGLVGTAIGDFLKARMTTVDYYDRSVQKPRTAKQLKEDQKELESYVQEKFKERTITLRYTP